jgi:hypothetical protein
MCRGSPCTEGGRDGLLVGFAGGDLALQVALLVIQVLKLQV